MSGQRYFFRVTLYSFVAILVSGCVGKKPDDDVALIKQLLIKFERGINQRSEVVLDSIIIDKKKNIASQLLDSLSFGGKLEGARIASKEFVIVKDSAEVRLRLGPRLKAETAIDEKQTQEIEKQVKLFLSKKRGKWRIKNFSMFAD